MKYESVRVYALVSWWRMALSLGLAKVWFLCRYTDLVEFRLAVSRFIDLEGHWSYLSWKTYKYKIIQNYIQLYFKKFMKSKILKIQKTLKKCFMRSNLNKAAQNVQKSVLEVTVSAHFIVPGLSLYHDGHLISSIEIRKWKYDNFSKNKSETWVWMFLSGFVRKIYWIIKSWNLLQEYSNHKRLFQYCM